MRAGRPIEHIELPNGWEVRYKIWNTGLGKGKRDRQFVSPAGTFLRSKRELMDVAPVLEHLGSATST